MTNEAQAFFIVAAEAKKRFEGGRCSQKKACM